MHILKKVMDDSYLNDFSPIEVVVTGKLEDAIHKFRALVTKEKVMSYLKQHYAYEKPSDKKRRKSREAQQRQRKYNQMMKDPTWKDDE